jgi:hypothetical protein
MPRILSRDAQKLLAQVPEIYAFRCCDGSTFFNTQELGDAFGKMSDDAYAHHANNERNDFSRWVLEVIGDRKLANDLAKSGCKADASQAVANRIVFLTSRL